MLDDKEPQPTVDIPSRDSQKDESDLETPEVSQAPKAEVDYYLTGPKLYLVLGGIGLAIYLFALDVSVISTAIPAITVQFNATTDIGWYAAAYPLALCSLQPLSGKIYTYFSLKWSYFVFVSIFLLGSLLCAVSQSSNMFIVARAITGVGASGIFSGALSILAVVAPLSKRALYIASLTSVFGIATISGPIIGGALTTKVSWRWCFYINLPVGAFTLVALALFFKPPIRDTDKGTLWEKIQKIDVIGCAIFIPMIVMVLLALQWGGHQYAWKSATVIGLFCGAAVMIAIFLAWEYHKGDDAMIPFSVVLQRSILLSCLFSACMFGAYIINIYYMPEWFQVIKGASPLHSGVMTLPAVGSQVASSLISGLIVNRTGYYNPWFFIGIGSMAIAAGLYTTLTTSTGHAKWITYLVFQGIGGSSFQGPILAVQATLASRPRLIPVGLACSAFFQYFGASVFQSIALAIFQNQLVKSLKSRAGLDSAQVQILLDAGSGHARKATLDSFPNRLDSVLWAYNKAITNVFYASLAAAIVGFFVATGVEWKNVKAKPAPPPTPQSQNESETPVAAEKNENAPGTPISLHKDEEHGRV